VLLAGCKLVVLVLLEVMAESRRLQRERKTVRLMVVMYCADHHGGGGLCAACAELAAFADRKLELCPYGPDKPTCSNCPIHCYRPKPREMMQEVMRYAGPRMLKSHPVLAVMHLFDEKREPSPLPKRPRSQ
jgi:hypothetical protein